MHLTMGKVIILDVIQATSRGRITNVSELAPIFMDAEIAQLCWECRDEHRVAVEESGQARGCRGVSQSPAHAEDKLNSRRTLRASESCTYVEHVARCDRSGYCWLSPLLGEHCTDRRDSWEWADGVRRRGRPPSSPRS